MKWALTTHQQHKNWSKLKFTLSRYSKVKKYAELVEPSKSELPQKMLSSLAAILHDTDDT